MGKVVEFNNVYLEYPDELENINEEKLQSNSENTMDLNELSASSQTETEEEINKKEIVESRTTKLSIKELQQKLEETQTLHL